MMKTKRLRKKQLRSDWNERVWKSMLEEKEGADLPQSRGDTERIEDERANAVAIVGWGHLVCPFYAAAK